MRIIAAIHRIKDNLEKENMNNPNSELFRFLKKNADVDDDDYGDNENEHGVWYDANEDPNDPIQEADNVPVYCKGEGIMMVIRKFYYFMSCKDHF